MKSQGKVTEGTSSVLKRLLAAIKGLFESLLFYIGLIFAIFGAIVLMLGLMLNADSSKACAANGPKLYRIGDFVVARHCPVAPRTVTYGGNIHVF